MARVVRPPRPDRHRLSAERSRQGPATPRTRGARPRQLAQFPESGPIRPRPKSSAPPLQPPADRDPGAFHSRRVPHLIFWFWPPAHLPAPAGGCAATPGAPAPDVALMPPARRRRGNPPAHCERRRCRMQLPHAQHDRDVRERVSRRDPRPIFGSLVRLSCAGGAGGGAAGTPTPRRRRRRPEPGSSSRGPTARS